MRTLVNLVVLVSIFFGLNYFFGSLPETTATWMSIIQAHACTWFCFYLLTMIRKEKEFREIRLFIMTVLIIVVIGLLDVRSVYAILIAGLLVSIVAFASVRRMYFPGRSDASFFINDLLLLGERGFYDWPLRCGTKVEKLKIGRNELVVGPISLNIARERRAIQIKTYFYAQRISDCAEKNTDKNTPVRYSALEAKIVDSIKTKLSNELEECRNFSSFIERVEAGSIEPIKIDFSPFFLIWPGQGEVVKNVLIP